MGGLTTPPSRPVDAPGRSTQQQYHDDGVEAVRHDYATPRHILGCKGAIAGFAPEIEEAIRQSFREGGKGIHKIVTEHGVGTGTAG
jgi:hypothetical protein